jgi:hypothetical protein
VPEIHNKIHSSFRATPGLRDPESPSSSPLSKGGDTVGVLDAGFHRHDEKSRALLF